MARETGGSFLLRLEDIDRVRCSAEHEQLLLEDLEWLGIEWDEPPRRQSDHFDVYQDALDTLADEGLVYPSFMTRGEIRQCVAQAKETGKTVGFDPDGAPIYPGKERDWGAEQREAMQFAKPIHNLRLDTKAAVHLCGGPLEFEETGTGPDGETGLCVAQPERWGDVVLARSDTPTSYHLSVVVDDAVQGVTHVVRGQDLFHATSVHRVLQTLLGYPCPVYHHHALVMDDTRRKLSKSAGDTSLRALRAAGMTPRDIERMVGL